MVEEWVHDIGNSMIFCSLVFKIWSYIWNWNNPREKESRPARREFQIKEFLPPLSNWHRIILRCCSIDWKVSKPPKLSYSAGVPCVSSVRVIFFLHFLQFRYFWCFMVVFLVYSGWMNSYIRCTVSFYFKGMN